MSLARHTETTLREALAQAATVRATQDVVLVNLLAELLTRGAEPPRGLTRIDWLRTLDPTLTAGQAKALTTVGAAITEPRWAELRARVSMQHVTVANAAQVITFHTRVTPIADPEQLDPIITELTERAATTRPEDLARLIRQETDHLTPPPDADRRAQGQRAARGLWFGQPTTTGMVGLRATLDPEAAAIVKAAIDGLSQPRPVTDEHGRTLEPDPRGPAKRRADALLEVIGRGVASAKGQPVTERAKLVITIDFDVLRGLLAGSGLTGTGEVIDAATARRMACDAGLIPMVLGGPSAPLDVGRLERLVTPAMRKALEVRDGGCTFGNCSTPATWCHAHHIVAWYRGGGTSVRELALLCPQHHTYVHDHDLTATVTATGVTWHE